ncbi:multiple epidermal growth factor-like domains protein 10 [Cydia pomonella]|uniref:multiple epidermal growth factor-like domains protein 10 n=1 Tax=Cydia pomonella TaxID=82600 RepID=UPI002ADDEBEE|nr:multiple epidermal growth factor-like domains protein 10 [Cydia pomonella]
MKLWCVFCLFLVGLEVGLVDGLKASQKGVCVSKHTVTKTRPKTILVPTGKWCGAKRCTVKQTRKQKYTVVTNQLMCCKGYVYTSSTDSCAPVCSTGCVNGTCVDPDVCQCAAPRYLDPNTRNKCLTPTCDHVCVNGFCSVNNTCVCNENYTSYNATHCAVNCAEGFEIDASLNCVLKCEAPLYRLKDKCLTPACDHPCVNGFCSVNNTCVCKDGYTAFNATHCAVNCTDQLDYLSCASKSTLYSVCDHGYRLNKGKCVPVCEPPCVNGICVAPNVCECDKTLVKKNGRVCQEKQHGCGECRADGTCLMTTNESGTRSEETETELICCDLYNWDDDTEACVPDCEHGCINGICIAPNQCVCAPPMILHNSTTPNICLHPVCDQPCINGNCTADNQCTCNKGFTPIDLHTCVPHCTNCTNGDCVSPNVCNCHKGYTRKNGQCMPHCKSDCRNGYCSEPDKCICNDGYELKGDNCEPICDTPCQNGNCIAPNTCECKLGYKPKNGHKEICIPKCSSDCNNGYCAEPDKCTCNEGYELRGNKCQPVCKKTCQNGDCIAPNKCECKKGFEPKNGHNEICIPKCSTDCNNGYCSEPGKCTCNEGYALRDGKCQPVCKKSCQNGDCVAPNKCECKKGFEPKNGHREICIPKCSSDCSNGYCSEPGKCTCNNGYELRDHKCQPICKKPCQNGFCTSPNICKCKKGYEPKNGHKEICIPKCSSDCSNGYCSEPNKCTCNDGYEFKNNKCEPICQKSCTNGICVAPNKCKCLKGFEKAGDTCSPKCDLCTNGSCTGPNKCECNKGYEHTDKGCVPICEKTCINGYCSAPNECSCNTGFTQDTLNSSVCRKDCGPDMDLINETCVVSRKPSPEMSSGTTTTTGLASMQMTWIVGGAVLLLLVVLVLVVISRLYARKLPQKTPADDGHYGSVAYTVPNTLFRKDDLIEEEETSDTLLDKGTSVV